MCKNRKIGFLITSKGWGGLEMNMLKLAKWLNSRGISIFLFTLQKIRVAQEAEKYPVEIITIPSHRKYFDFWKACLLAKTLKQHNIEKLMLFANSDIDTATLTKRFYKKDLQLIYLQQMLIGVNKKDFLHSWRYKKIDKWITPSHIAFDELQQKTTINKSKVTIAPLSVEIQQFTDIQQTKEQARTSLNISPDSFVVGIIGRIDIQKGQYFLTQAFHHFLQKNPKKDIHLLIVGNPTVEEQAAVDYFNKIKQYIKDNSLQSRITLHPAMKDSTTFFRAINLFILASTNEPFGMVTIEALLTKTPMIGTKAGSTPELLEQGKFGLLYEVNNQQSFINKLTWAVDNIKTMNAMAEKGQKTAMKKYNHINYAQQIEETIFKPIVE